jgi:hypothetical protein
MENYDVMVVLSRDEHETLIAHLSQLKISNFLTDEEAALMYSAYRKLKVVIEVHAEDPTNAL